MVLTKSTTKEAYLVNGSIYQTTTHCEELIEAFKQLHKDEADPEFMFQDWEGSSLFEKMDLIGESYLSEDIFDVLEAIEKSGYSEEVLEAYISCYGIEENIHELIKKVEEAYQGEYNSDEEFAQDFLEETGDIPQDLPSYIYIDWERTARDIMFDYSIDNKHYFRVI